MLYNRKDKLEPSKQKMSPKAGKNQPGRGAGKLGSDVTLKL